MSFNHPVPSTLPRNFGFRQPGKWLITIDWHTMQQVKEVQAQQKQFDHGVGISVKLSDEMHSFTHPVMFSSAEESRVKLSYP